MNLESAVDIYKYNMCSINEIILCLPSEKHICISDINLSNLDIDRKITLLKNNKAAGPDGISPKLLKLAGTAVVGPLTSLFMQSIRECRVYNNWKVARL